MKDHGVTRTRSEGEAELLQLCLDHDLPRPGGIERVQQRQGLRLMLEVGSTAPLYAGCSSN